MPSHRFATSLENHYSAGHFCLRTTIFQDTPIVNFSFMKKFSLESDGSPDSIHRRVDFDLVSGQSTRLIHPST